MRKEGRGTDRQERRKEGREKGRKGENEDGIRQCRTIRLLLQVIPKLRRGPKWQGKTETSEGRAWGAWKRRGEEVQVGPSLNLTYHLFLVRSDVKQGKKKHYFRKRRWFFIGQTKTGEYQVNRVRVGYRQPRRVGLVGRAFVYRYPEVPGETPLGLRVAFARQKEAPVRQPELSSSSANAARTTGSNQAEQAVHLAATKGVEARALRECFAIAL
jgi:hypothetical protein